MIHGVIIGRLLKIFIEVSLFIIRLFFCIPSNDVIVGIFMIYFDDMPQTVA